MRENTIKFEMREASPGYLVLSCNGGLSWEDREMLAASVEEYFAGRDELAGVVMDLASIAYINSAGLGALFQLVQRLRARGGALAFANVPAQLLRLFDAVGLSRVATVGDDVRDALALLKESRTPAASDPDGDSPPD